ncbi:MAG: hypothetical protein WCA21_06520 [Terracidiphilus sp.]
MNPVLRMVRILQASMIVAVLLFYYVCYTIPSAPQIANPYFQWIIVFCAMASAVGGFFVQRIMQRAPRQIFPAAQESTPRKQWLTGHVVRFATAESVALFGFVLHTTGGTPVVVNLLFASSLLLLVLWQPGALPPQTDSQNSSHDPM